NISSFSISGKSFTLPSPIHSFLYLSENGFEWKGLGGNGVDGVFNTPSQIALQLGLRASDGVVFLFTKELNSAWSAREDVVRYSEKLGIDNNVKISIAKLDTAFLKGSDKEDLLDAIINIEVSMENSLRKKGRDDLSVLIEIGSWIGGLKMVSNGLLSNFKEEQTEVLRQSHISELCVEIIKEIIKRTEEENEKLFLGKFLDYLVKIDFIINSYEKNRITKESIKSLSILATEVKLFLDTPHNYKKP
ncbi:MAG: hypothetical protein EBS19_01800, partial [Spirochaetia bacterium]|nr:hypothetical protein [Spirochaetia bacterium]